MSFFLNCSEFTVDNMPAFSPGAVPSSNAWTIAYIPDDSATIDRIMQAAKLRLNNLNTLTNMTNCRAG